MPKSGAWRTCHPTRRPTISSTTAAPEQRAPEQRTVDVDVRDLDTRGRRLVGYASVYGVLSHDLGGFRERIAPGAFADVLAGAPDVRALLNHDPNEVLGRTRSGTLRLFDDGRGLRFEIDLPDSPLGDNVREAVARGDIDGASFRFKVGNETWDGDIRTITRVAELQDVTVATYGAYPDASVELRQRPDITTSTKEIAISDQHTEAVEATDDTTSSSAVVDDAVNSSTGSLRVEDRTAISNSTLEQRVRDVLRPDQSLTDWAESRSLPGFTPEARALSFDRLVRGMVTGDWRGADAEQRAISESPLSAGGYMVPTPVAASVIDRARNAARVFQAGATTVAMTSQTLKYPRLLTEATPAWRNEGAAINDQALTFDSVTFTAQSMAMLVKVSIELFEDASNTDDVISNSFAKQIALELDRVALRGSGTAPEPRGVRNQSGVTLTSHGANGTAISPLGTGLGYDFLLDAVGTCRTGNFEPNAVIAAPRLETSLGKLKEATTNAYAAAPSVDVLPRYPSNQIPTNLTVGTSTDCSEVYTADWSQLLVGIRTALQLRFLGERFIDNGQYAFLAYLRGDIQLGQPAAFVVDLGVRG